MQLGNIYDEPSFRSDLSQKDMEDLQRLKEKEQKEKEKKKEANKKRQETKKKNKEEAANRPPQTAEPLMYVDNSELRRSDRLKEKYDDNEEGSGFKHRYIGGAITSHKTIDPYRITQLMFTITQQAKNADIEFETNIMSNIKYINSTEKNKIRKVRDDINRHFDDLFEVRSNYSARDYIYGFEDNGEELFEVMQDAVETLVNDISVYMSNTPQVISEARYAPTSQDDTE